MSNKVIVVVIDGLRDDLAVENLGYMEHLLETDQAARCSIKSELPSLSRPLYEVLLTGTPSSVNGISSNGSVRLSKMESLFHLTRNHGLVNATASYYWVSELYNRAPFNYLEDREQENPEAIIQHGKFYWEDDYPDSHLILDGEVLRQRVNPDFLYIHSMNVDHAGHMFGSDSREYREKIIRVDNYLSELVPIWNQAGYQIVITADHGMTRWGLHGGTTDEERMVPLYIISNKVKSGLHEVVIPQLLFAPIICRLMNIPKSDRMLELSEPVLAMMEKE